MHAIRRRPGKVERRPRLGFIQSRHGGESIFVHVSAFQRHGRRPKLGETLSFEIEPASDGKKRAVSVQRVASRPTAGEGNRQVRGRRGRIPLRGCALALTVLTLLAFAYARFPAPGPAMPARQAVVLQSTVPAATQFRCDGRTMCSQMTSCDEATFFLKNCPGTQMDGDHDGIPCEQQWCTGPFAR